MEKELRIELTADGFFEVWHRNERISGEHPFVDRTMAEGWIRNWKEVHDVDA